MENNSVCYKRSSSQTLRSVFNPSIFNLRHTLTFLSQFLLFQSPIDLLLPLTSSPLFVPNQASMNECLQTRGGGGGEEEVSGADFN